MKIHLPRPWSDQNLFRRKEILHTHPYHESVDRRCIVYGVQATIRIIEDVNRLVPKAELFAPNTLDNPATLGSGGILAAVGFDAESHLPGLSVVAAFCHHFIIRLEKLFLGGT